MNTTQTPSLIDEMLQELSNSRQSTSKQIGAISDILEKSNNVLLQIEATRSLKPVPKTPNAVAYTYNKDTLHALATIVESFGKIIANEGRVNTEPLLGDLDTHQPVSDFEMFLSINRQKMEYLGGTVRKLLAVNDTVAQMKTILQHIMEANEEEEIYSD